MTWSFERKSVLVFDGQPRPASSRQSATASNHRRSRSRRGLISFCTRICPNVRQALLAVAQRRECLLLSATFLATERNFGSQSPSDA